MKSVPAHLPGLTEIDCCVLGHSGEECVARSSAPGIGLGRDLDADLCLHGIPSKSNELPERI